MSEFDEFWSLYPRRIAKRAAQKAWEKEMKAGTDPKLIIHGLRRQLPYFASRDEQFIPHAATWLNQGRFEDEVKAPQRPQPQHRQGDMADFLASRKDNRNERTLDAEFTRGSDRGSTPFALENVAFERRH